MNLRAWSIEVVNPTRVKGYINSKEKYVQWDRSKVIGLLGNKERVVVGKWTELELQRINRRISRSDTCEWIGSKLIQSGLNIMWGIKYYVNQ